MSMLGIEIELQGGHKIKVVLREPPTQTVKHLTTKLPIHSSAHRWGDEIYFEVPFHSELEADARQDMEIGEVAFWPEGDALAVFFGRTPASRSHMPRAYSPCNVVGKVEGDPSALRSVKEGASVVVKRLFGHWHV